MTGLLRLYPRWWRRRYGDEVDALLGSVAARPGDRVDILRGALDAWLHPPVPSRIPAVAALVGGGLWTVVAAGVFAQPTQPDWPGYLDEALGAALVSVGFLLVALVGIAIRGFDAMGRAMGLLTCLAVVAYAAWMLAIVGSMADTVDGPTLAEAQTVAMVVTAAIGLVLVHLGDGWIGSLVLVAGVTLVLPWAGAWLAFGAVWTAIGVGLVMERPGRRGMDRGVA